MEKENGDTSSTEKQEVDNESLVVHVDGSSLLELEADLTKPEGKATAEDPAAVAQTDAGTQKESGPGKEKWEFEGQEKKDEGDTSEQAEQAVSKTDEETAGDNTTSNDTIGDMKDSQSVDSTDAQRRRFVAITSSISFKVRLEKPWI